MKFLKTWVQSALMAVIVSVILGGCSNPYKEFYEPRSFALSVVPGAYKGNPRISYGSGDGLQNVNRMFEQGYTLIGSAAFVGAKQSEDGALEQAKAVGAAVVVLFSNYVSTVSGSMPVTTPTTTTSYSSGTASAYGSGGYASGTYSGTTTTYGTQTTHIPWSVGRFDQVALFFAPHPRKGLGARIGALTNEQKRLIDSNQGLQILAVANGSPAYNANLFAGDIVLSIDGQQIYDFKSSFDAVVGAKGREADYVIFRNGKRVTGKVLVPLGEW